LGGRVRVDERRDNAQHPWHQLRKLNALPCPESTTARRTDPQPHPQRPKATAKADRGAPQTFCAIRPSPSKFLRPRRQSQRNLPTDRARNTFVSYRLEFHRLG